MPHYAIVFSAEPPTRETHLSLSDFLATHHAVKVSDSTFCVEFPQGESRLHEALREHLSESDDLIVLRVQKAVWSVGLDDLNERMKRIFAP
jgi:hypothetical protein